MLALFRNNEFFTLFLLAAYIAVLRLPMLLGWVPPLVAEPSAGGGLYQWIFSLLDISSRTSVLLAAVLVLAQSFFLYRLASTYRLMSERTWLPAMLYGYVASCIPDFLSLSPALIAVTFVLLALHPLFSTYRRPLVFSTVVDTAVWLVLAALSYPPSFWFLLIGFFSFFLLRSFSVREQAAYVVAILALLIILQAALFWYDRTSDFWRVQLGQAFQWPRAQFPEDPRVRFSIILMGGLFLVSALGFNVYYAKRSIQVRKYIDLLYWFFLAGTLSAVFRVGDHLDGFLLCAPSVSLFLSYLFLSSRNALLMELLHLALLMAALGIQLYEPVS